MDVYVGLEYDGNGYIHSAIWWKVGFNPHILDPEKCYKYKVMNICITKYAALGDNLYGVVMGYKNSDKKESEVLGELLFRHDGEAYSSIAKTKQLPFYANYYRTIRIPYWNSETNEKIETPIAIEDNNTEVCMLTLHDMEILKAKVNRTYTIFNEIKGYIMRCDLDIDDKAGKFLVAKRDYDDINNILNKAKIISTRRLK